MESASEMQGADGGGDRAESSAPTDETYRSHFASWLGGMSEEVRQLAFLLEREEASAPLRRLAADSLNQLLHIADMLPEGTEALGYLETCFAFRLLAAEQSEAAFSAPRLPRPRLPKPVPAKAMAPTPVPVVERSEPEADDVAAEVSADGSGAELAEGNEADLDAAEAVPAEADAAQDVAAEPSEAVMSEAVGADGERVAVPLPAAPEEAAPEEVSEEPAEPNAVEAAALADETEAEAALEVAAADDAVAAEEAAIEAAAIDDEPEEEPERAQASDESYAVVRRLAPQAALVRAFLGTEDADRLRRLVLEQRGRPSRGRSSKEILLESDARAAAAGDARDWAELYEVPEFGNTQHDLLRLRTFMKTRVRRVPA